MSRKKNLHNFLRECKKFEKYHKLLVLAVGAPDLSRIQIGSPQSLNLLQQFHDSQNFPPILCLERRRDEFYDAGISSLLAKSTVHALP